MSQFSEFDAAFEAGGMESLLQQTEQHLRQANCFHELFEVLKMQARHGLDLPLLPEDDAELSDQKQAQLEDALLDACRDVGVSLLRSGQIQDSWMYLRHLMDRGLVKNELAAVEVTEENLDQVLALLLHEGLDVERGFGLVLQHYGTCNAITTMQSALYGKDKADRQTAGGLLVRHVHAELLENVKAHVQREEDTIPGDERLESLVRARPWLCADGSYHIDTSHLSSTVQISIELSDRESLEIARDLCMYGQQLDKQLQYAGDPPFEDLYATGAIYFGAQLGIDVEASIASFRARAEATDAHQEGTYPIEVFIDLLSRVGRLEDAIEASTRLIPQGIQTTSRAPSLYELSKQLGDFRRFRDICRDRADVLGYVISKQH